LTPVDDLLGQLVGNYRVVQPLGAGAMGSLYIAEHPELGRRMAVKFLAPELVASTEMTERFLAEARVLARIQHPNVVEIYDFGRVADRFFFLMELLEGQDLGGLLDEKGSLSPTETWPYLEQICAALTATHGQGVVHRDLKPSNIFVQKGDPPRLKLIDFGIAKAMERASSSVERTGEGSVLGTPTYMAPEQASGRGRRITPRTDLYSLGVLLYRVLAGRAPFEADSPLELIGMHLYKDPPPLSGAAPAVDEGIARLVLDCLRKEPDERPASAAEVASRFRALLAGAGSPPGAPRSEGARATSAAPTAPAPEAPRTSELAATAVLARPRAGSEAKEAPATEEAVAVDAPPAAALAPPALESPAPESPELAREESESEEEALLALLKWMEKKGDFPAISKSVSEVSSKALRIASTSASQLADAIEKDFGLATKLLKVVNSAFYERGIGKIGSIKHAVVILGFEQIRMAALSLTLFQNVEDRELADELMEGAVLSVMSGELARGLAVKAGVSAVEESFICSMFRDVGKQMMLYCLPGPYREMQRLIEEKGLDEDRAARHVFGLSFEQISVGICKHWNLSTRMSASIKRLPPGKVPRPRSEQELPRIVANLSRELCDLVARVPVEEQPARLEAVAVRFGDALPIVRRGLPELLRSASRSFEGRYAGLLGTDRKRSAVLGRFLKWQAREEPSASPTESPPPKAPPPPPSPSPFAAVRARAAALEETIARINEKIAAGRSPDEVLQLVLETMARELSFSRVLLFILRPDRLEMELRAGQGPGVEALVRKTRVPVGESAEDLFSRSVFGQRDVIVEDTSATRDRWRIPEWYDGILAAPAFVLYPLALQKRPIGLFYADATPRLRLSEDDRPYLARLRNLALQALRWELGPDAARPRR
jgi:eukaryotic-like serine/threonine-protein kinase